eukprot:m.123680 g.123680  ORF g.123680 m.123680 type:complete len:504 (-) comp14630_c0_seq4:23-1534(-)
MSALLLELPQEILCYIAEFLEEYDILALMSSCTYLRTLLLEATLWRNRYLTYARAFQSYADFALDNTPAWRLLTMNGSELQDQFYYSVDLAGQRGFHAELQYPIESVSHAPGRWRQALICLLSSRCESCGSYCGTVNILLLVRVCDKCAQEKMDYKVVPLDTLLSFLPPEHAALAKLLPMRALKSEVADEPNRAYVSLAHVRKALRVREADASTGIEDNSTPYDSWLFSSTMSGRFALAHFGYMMRPMKALTEQSRSHAAAHVDMLLGSIGGPRTSEMRYLWCGMQSAVECRCGAQGPAAAMLDHYEIMHCHVPPPFDPHAVVGARQTICFAESELRQHATAHLQHYINFGQMTLEEQAHVLNLARTIQPLNHWEEHVAGDPSGSAGEIHGAFVVHGRRRVAFWYRLEYDLCSGSMAIVRELVGCPLSSEIHHSKIGTRISCEITNGSDVVLHRTASTAELSSIKAALGVGAEIRDSVFTDLLKACTLGMFSSTSALSVATHA